MSTRQQILDLAQALIQTRGYNAFSYKDIAAELGIKTPSIHYHFPKKEELGVAVVERYIETFDTYIKAAWDTTDDAWERLDQYLGPFIEVRKSKTKICLCAALAGEFLGLPESVQVQVARFFTEHERWLRALVIHGVKTEAFTLTTDPKVEASFILSALQGSLIIARARNDAKHFQRVVQTVKNRLQTE